MTIGRRPLIASTLLAMGLLLSSLSALTGRAAYTVCYTDPVVSLSDGSTVTMYAQTQDDPAYITGVDYELHVPTGVTITGMSYDQYGYLETVTIVQDQLAGSYSVGTTVSTSNGTVPVTANASVTSLTCNIPNTWKSGPSGKQLWIYFTC